MASNNIIPALIFLLSASMAPGTVQGSTTGDAATGVLSDERPAGITSQMERYLVPHAKQPEYLEFIAALDLPENERQAARELYDDYTRTVREIIHGPRDLKPGFAANERSFQLIWNHLDHQFELLIAAILELSQAGWEAEPEREVQAIEAANAFRRRVLLGSIRLLEGYLAFHYAGDGLDLSVLFLQAISEETTTYSHSVSYWWAPIRVAERSLQSVTTGEFHALIVPEGSPEAIERLTGARKEIERAVEQYVTQLDALLPGYFRQWRSNTFRYKAALEIDDERTMRRLWRDEVHRWRSLHRLNSSTANLIGTLAEEALGQEARQAWQRRALSAMYPYVYDFFEETLWTWLEEQPLDPEQRFQIEQLREEYTPRYAEARGRAVQHILESRSRRHPAFERVSGDGITLFTKVSLAESGLSRNILKIMDEPLHGNVNRKIQEITRRPR